MKPDDTIKLDREEFEFVQLNQQIKDEKFQGEAIGFFKDAMIRFTRNTAAIVAGWIILVIIILAVFGPMMNPYTYREQNLQAALLPSRIPLLEKIGIFDGTRVKNIRKSSLESRYQGSVKEIIDEYELDYHGRKIEMLKVKVDMYKFKNMREKYFWFGTDSIGRDLWTRLWRGSRISLIIATLAVLVNVFIGIIYGAISGYYGGKVDMYMQRIIEILAGIPSLVLVILFIIYIGPGIIPLAMAMVLTGWIGMSRMIRAQFYKYKGQEYVLASRTMGARDRKLIFRHVLPNAIGPTITQATLAIPGAIFTESFLAYLGLGLQAPEPSIGVLLAEGQKQLLNYPHLTLFPAMLISILMLSFNLFGNGLRDAFDPTLRGHE